MNIHEAAISGMPFCHPDMIGAWLIVDGKMVHRDNVADFENMEFIREWCVPVNRWLYWLDVSDLMRTDWYIV